jgi:hypothetical protein
MTIPEWTQGIVTTAIVIVAGVISFSYVNQRFPPPSIERERPAASSTAKPDDATINAAGPCVAADGSWKNWPFPNVPMLAPECAPAK